MGNPASPKASTPSSKWCTPVPRLSSIYLLTYPPPSNYQLEYKGTRRTDHCWLCGCRQETLPAVVPNSPQTGPDHRQVVCLFVFLEGCDVARRPADLREFRAGRSLVFTFLNMNILKTMAVPRNWGLGEMPANPTGWTARREQSTQGSPSPGATQPLSLPQGTPHVSRGQRHGEQRCVLSDILRSMGKYYKRKIMK